MSASLSFDKWLDAVDARVLFGGGPRLAACPRSAVSPLRRLFDEGAPPVEAALLVLRASGPDPDPPRLVTQPPLGV